VAIEGGSTSGIAVGPFRGLASFLLLLWWLLLPILASKPRVHHAPRFWMRTLQPGLGDRIAPHGYLSSDTLSTRSA